MPYSVQPSVYLMTINGGIDGLFFYVGKAIRPKRRWADHLRDLKIHRHSNAKLQRAWDKYGSTAFSFCIIGTAAAEALVAEEQRHLDKFVKEFGGSRVLNICRKCVDLRFGVRHTRKTRKKLSDVMKIKWLDPDYRANQTVAIKTANSTPEKCALNSAIQKVIKNRPENKEKNRQAAIRSGQDLVTKAKRAATNARPEVRQKRSASVIAALAKPEARARTLEINRDPEINARRKISASITNALPTTKRRRSDAAKKAQESPEYRQRQREIQLIAQNRPETKALKSSKVRAALAREETKAKRAATNARPEVKLRRSMAAIAWRQRKAKQAIAGAVL